jgi:citronellol/citronellal dehydrogenase
MADAAFALLKTENRAITGQLLIDEDFLRTQGVENFEQYRANPESDKTDLMPDLFVQEAGAYVRGTVAPLAGLANE